MSWSGVGNRNNYGKLIINTNYSISSLGYQETDECSQGVDCPWENDKIVIWLMEEKIFLESNGPHCLIACNFDLID